MKKIYDKPMLYNVDLASNNVFTLSTGANANIAWGEVESNSWESLFGDSNN